jgi:predicted site-specific integrase-resolvase
MLNVSRWTLREWEDSGKLTYATKTAGGHRRYRQSDILNLMGVQTTSYDNPDVVCIYSRVSSHDQKKKGDLDRQKSRLLEMAVKKKYNVEFIFSEVGSGMNDNRAKLKRLFELVSAKMINRVIVEHKDRLTRFNWNYIEAFFNSHGVTIEVIKDTLPKSYEAELVEDILSLMASFSAKIYGRRSSQNRKTGNQY